jgi:hypothetical protein
MLWKETRLYSNQSLVEVSVSSLVRTLHVEKVKYRIILSVSRAAYTKMGVLRTGLGDGLGDGLGFPKCKFRREHHNRRVLRPEK